MKYFAAQVRTTKEETYIEQINQKLLFRSDKQSFIFLKRKMPIRKLGKTSIQILPLFPGYIFIETENIDPQLYNIMRHNNGFFKFLAANDNIIELEGRDLSILKHFINFGSVAETSKVWFDENDRIKVSSGPLSGLEGCITKVDKRKKRAKVQLDFANNSFSLDLSFEVLEKNTNTTTNEKINKDGEVNSNASK